MANSGGGYDWNSDESKAKWRGIFVQPLAKILRQHSEHLIAVHEALEHVESLLLKLLGVLTVRPSPVVVADIEDRVIRTFSSPLDKNTLTYAQTVLDKGKRKSNLCLPIDKAHVVLKDVLQNHRLDDQVTLFIIAILEYVATDILKVNYRICKKMSLSEVTQADD